ncbi:MAG: DUF4395 domain-containing protein [Myxococcota bacterium]
MAFFQFPSEVNERAARIVAGVVASTIVVAFAADQRWLLPVLAFGFWLRVGFGPKVSPLARLAVKLAPRLGEPILVPGPPKRFAQLLGALFTTTAAALVFSGSPLLGWALSLTVAFLASLESTLAACLGCWIYGACAVRLKPAPAEGR